jgi:formiminotetrahydrofolate cyclodeaminase
MSTSDERIGAWLDQLGSGSPTPGGGAAAGVVAATGAGLIAMVGHLTVGKEGFQDLDGRMRDLIERADGERRTFLQLAEEDAEAFEQVMASFRLPKQSDEETAARALAIQDAYRGAAAVPLQLARRAVDLMELAEDATALGNPHAASDGYSAGALLFASALAAMANVRINAAGLKDEASAQSLVEQCDSLRERAETLLQQVEEAFLLRLKT